jgi:hypothetical protein
MVAVLRQLQFVVFSWRKDDKTMVIVFSPRKDDETTKQKAKKTTR